MCERVGYHSNLSLSCSWCGDRKTFCALQVMPLRKGPISIALGVSLPILGEASLCLVIKSYCATAHIESTTRDRGSSRVCVLDLALDHDYRTSGV